MARAEMDRFRVEFVMARELPCVGNLMLAEEDFEFLEHAPPASSSQSHRSAPRGRLP